MKELKRSYTDGLGLKIKELQGMDCAERNKEQLCMDWAERVKEQLAMDWVERVKEQIRDVFVLKGLNLTAQ